MKKHSSCEIEYFGETHICKLCVILRSRALRVVVVIPRYAIVGRLSLQRVRKTNYCLAVPTNKITGPPPTRTKTLAIVPQETPTHQPSHSPTNRPTIHVLQQYNSTYSSKLMRWFVLEFLQGVRRYSGENQALNCSDTEGFLNRGWGPFLPELPSLSHSTHLPAPANQRLARGIGVPTACEAVSTRENSIFVPGVLEW